MSYGVLSSYYVLKWFPTKILDTEYYEFFTQAEHVMWLIYQGKKKICECKNFLIFIKNWLIFPLIISQWKYTVCPKKIEMFFNILTVGDR